MNDIPICSVTNIQYEQVMSNKIIEKWVYARKRNRRVRAMIACTIHFCMKEDKWYTAAELADSMRLYEVGGRSASIVSSRRTAMLLKQLDAKGVIQALYRTSTGMYEYRRL